MKTIIILKNYESFEKDEKIKLFYDGTGYELWKRDSLGLCGWKTPYINELVEKGIAKYI